MCRRTKLILVPCAGLCNRLQAVVYGQLLAEDTGREFFLDWAPAANCAIEFDELFVPAFPTLEELPEDLVCYSSIQRHIHSAPDRYMEFLKGTPEERFTKLKTDPSKNIAIVTCHQFLGYFHDQRFGHWLRNLLRRVRPEISREANEFRKRHFSERTVGVHIRRGDWRSQRGLDYYMAIMSKFPGATFFISSDDPTVFREIHDRFPGAIEFPKSSFHRGDREGLIEAMIDVLLLSSTVYLIGTPGSSFSALPSAAGAIPGNFGYGHSVSIRDWKLGNLTNPGRTLLGRLRRSATDYVEKQSAH